MRKKIQQLKVGDYVIISNPFIEEDKLKNRIGRIIDIDWKPYDIKIKFLKPHPDDRNVYYIYDREELTKITEREAIAWLI